MNNTLFSIISAVIFAATSITIGYFANQTAQQYLKNTAVDTCYAAATIEVQQTATGEATIKTISTPENYWYTVCMKEKGYK